MTGEQSNIEYLLSGVDDHGRRRHERIEAESPEAAKEEMDRRGYREVQLHTDDLLRNVGLGQLGRSVRPRDRMSPKDEVALHSSGMLANRLRIAKVIYRGAYPLLIALSVAVCIAGYNRGSLTGAVIAIALLGVAPVLIALVMPMKVGVLNQAEEAFYEADWQRLLKLIPRLRRAVRVLPAATAEYMVVQKEAGALVRLGRRDEAFRLVEGLRSAGVEEHMVQVRLASLHLYSRDFDEAEACYRRSAELNPENWMPWAELANFLTTFVQKPHEARQALSKIRTSSLSEESKWAVRMSEATIALCEGRFEAARDNLSQTIEHVTSLIPSNPGWKGARDFYSAFLAISLIRTGRREEAQRLFESIEPFLTRHEYVDLLAQCATAGLRLSR